MSQEEQIVVPKSELNLAGYMKANGAELQGFDSRGFHFKSCTNETQWRVDHSNSCCFRVDNEMLALKRMSRNK